jgi:glycosyltransferase involved in cell wall biosynthesis
MYHVLWLASWYPGRVDAFTGDFIERHAFAVSNFVKLTVLFVVKDETMQPGKFIVEKSCKANLTAYRVYYGKSKYTGLIEKIHSFKTCKQLQKRIYQQIENEQGKPDMVHVHVAVKAGMLARYIKKKFQIPYFVTEHWSGYFKECTPNVYTGNWFLNRLNKKILQETDLLFPVTENLGAVINKNFVSVEYKVIPNVVDTNLFWHKPVTPARFRFIHPSGMDDNKNPSGILKACTIVKEKGYDFELLMVGGSDDLIMKIAGQSGFLKNSVIFKSTIPYCEVAIEMQRSSALLLFSNFESLPCVILEALCCGLPVISSNVGGINEVIDDENGILVESGNTEQLVTAICKLIDNYKTYNQQSIAQKAFEKFNYNTVGQQYFNQYKLLLHP